MELIYLHIRKYGNLFKEQEFNFSSNHLVTFKEGELLVEENKTVIKHYYGANINNVAMFLGQNGVGKSTLLEIELLDLENRYKHLKQNVQEIIIKAKAYDSIYQKQLKEVFGLSDKELESFLFGYTENHLDRILSKFNMDILNEFRN